MASLEKLVKALEALKVFQPGAPPEDTASKKKDQVLSKKDQISNCHVITDCICSLNLRNIADFPKFLGIAIETFLAMCDDQESDVRMVADECLNRTIKTLLETNQGRLQVELYKEIKKNASQRSLRAALWRFADLCHLIRPQKCRPYVVNLLPCVARVCRRPEEAVQETLAAAMAKLCPALMGFTTDTEVKILLKAFLPNIKSSSATTRRTAASSLTLICQYSRKPQMFFSWLLTTLLTQVVPVSENEDICLLLGLCLSVRHMVPHLSDDASAGTGALKGSFGAKSKDAEVKVSTAQVVQVYELLLHYTSHSDHNVVTASLETLQQLLKSPPPDFQGVLLTPGGIGQTSIHPGDEGVQHFNRTASAAQLPTIGDDKELEDDDVGDSSSSSSSSSSSNEDIPSLPVAPPDPQVDNRNNDTGNKQQQQRDHEEEEDVMEVNGNEEGEEEQMDGDVVVSSAIVAAGGDSQRYSNIEIGEVGEEVSQAMSTSSSVDTLSDLQSPTTGTAAQGDEDKVSASHERLNTGEEVSATVTGKELDVSEVIQPNQGSSVPRTGDIGSIMSPGERPLVHCARLLASKFLLMGYPHSLVPDRQARVSVKALALGCLAAIVSMHPRVLATKLHITATGTGELQNLRDLLAYTSHSDPQLKGNTALLIGCFIKSALVESRGRVAKWIAALGAKELLSVEDLMLNLTGILDDESSVAVRLALMALRSCMPVVLESIHSDLGLKALLALFQVSNNPYWLVKVELLDLLSELDMKLLAYLEVLCTDVRRGKHHFTGRLCLQRHILHDIVLTLVGDDDQRVRQAAARSLARLVPRLFYAIDAAQQDPIVARAQASSAAHLHPIMHEWSHVEPTSTTSSSAGSSSSSSSSGVPGLIRPYDSVAAASSGGASEQETIGAALSRVVSALLQTLSRSTKKQLTLGCLQALSQLSEDFPVPLYSGAWCCTPPSRPSAPQRSHSTGSNASLGSMLSGLSLEDLGSGSGGGPLPLIMSILTSSHISLDLTAHHHALTLAGNVFAGAAYKCLRGNSPGESGSTDEESRWAVLADRMLVPLADILLAHLARLLNICWHLLDDQSPGPPQSKPGLPSLPTAPSLSPIKRKAGGKGASDAGNPQQSSTATEKGSTGKAGQKDGPKDSDKDKGGGGGVAGGKALGAFYNLPHYMKLYEVLKGAYSNYQVSLDMSSRDKFGQILRSTLEVLAMTLEIAGLAEVGKYAEEFLSYLKATVLLEPTPTLLTVQQLLKALFGTNLASQWENSSSPNSSRKPGKATRLTSGVRPGLYHCCFTTPYTQFTQCLATATFRTAGSMAEQEESSSWLSWMKKRVEKKVPAILKPGSKTDKSSIASYIRLFEPLVIKALKQYTVTSSLHLQRQVLSLLAQLVQLRVNYCLLDSDQIFIGFVIKQFEFIENGQIRNSETLIPQIFHFLVLLSYERYHSKPIIGMPKIIQLCDGIMASGQDPQTHAIPALQSIVHDLFVLRSTAKSDAAKDLDTQREFVVSMLLRLIHYHQVLELLIVVLHQCHKEGEDKWKRLSRQVTDLILPLLAKQQLQLDSQIALDVVHRLFEAVAPSVFRPVDILLKTMFAPPTDLSSVMGVQRWLCLILASLRVLISQSKEETVLSRLQELALTVGVFRTTLDKHKQTTTVDGPGKAESPLGISAEEVLARFLLQVVGLVAMEIRCQVTNLMSTDYSFLCQELAHLLLYVMHMFQSGVYRRVATIAMSLIHRQVPGHFFSIQDINATFRDIAVCHPTLTLQWCNILILMNFNDQGWWSDILQTQRKYMNCSPGHGKLESTDVLLAKTRCANLEIVRRGGVILFCDYVCENLSDAEQMTWVIINHVNDLIQLSLEPPVQDFIGAIHRNSAASGLFIQAIHSRCENFTKPSLVRQTLQCVESIHQSQSGSLLTLLIDTFLPTKHLTVARSCDSIACRRLEMLLADSVSAAASQLPLEDVDKLLDYMKSHKLSKRHARLSTLLSKLRDAITQQQQSSGSSRSSSGEEGGEKTHPLAITSSPLAEIKINKDWFVSIARAQCFHCSTSPGGVSARDGAQLLQHLDYTSLLNVIMSKECKLSVIGECLVLGMQCSLSSYQQNQDESPSPSDPPHSPSRDKPLHPLFKAAQITLFRHINSVINMLPVPHQVISYSSSSTQKEDEYRDKLEDIFSEQTWFDTIFQLAEALVRYMVALIMFPWQPVIPEEAQKDIGRFSVLCLELVHWQSVHGRFPSPQRLETTLECFSLVLQNPRLNAVIGEKEQTTWVCTAIRAIHQILSSALVLPEDRLVTLPNQDSSDDNADGATFDDLHHAVRACDQISELVHCLKTHLSREQLTARLPSCLANPIRNCIVGLARLPLVNSYARTPPLVWTLGWLPSPSGDMRTCLPPLPLHYLQEKDVLREFIYRVNLLGWTSRQQFEETWMALLGVLNPVMLNEQIGQSPEEDVDRCQCMVLATRCITSLLVQSSLSPQSGNPSNSTPEHRPRDKPLIFLQTRVGKKLSYVRGIVERELRSLSRQRTDVDPHYVYSCRGGETDVKSSLFVSNLERYMAHNDGYGLGQTCIEYTWAFLGMIDAEAIATGMHESSSSDTTTGDTVSSAESPQASYPPVHRLAIPLVNLAAQKERSLAGAAASGLDIHSCLQFLLELYGQLLAPNANPRTPLMQLNETVKSVVALSDVFTEKQQYEWLVSVLLELLKFHPAEDEQLNQYIVAGLCKAAAVIGMDPPTLDRIVKLIETSLRSTHLPTKISALFGCLYLLETGMTEATNQIIPLVTDYLSKSLSSITPSTIHSHQHVSVMWSCAFYVMENYSDDIKDAEFSPKMLHTAIATLSAPEEVSSLGIYSLVLRGLERLVLADVITPQDIHTLIKLSVDRLCLPSPHRALGALGLMLSCMYAGKHNDAWSPDGNSPHADPESLIVAMERVTVLFDRIRKGFPYEARVISRVLPTFLADFFPPQDIMNKVIGEFLSGQQPHPQLMAKVVHQVFRSLMEKSQHAVVQDWVMLSLSNVTQRTPAAMAVWSLTCFFISASTNPWLRSLLSHLLSRMGRLEEVDQKLFILAALDFKHSLTDAAHVRAFLATFQAVTQPGLPYAQLLACCN